MNFCSRLPHLYNDYDDKTSCDSYFLLTHDIADVMQTVKFPMTHNHVTNYAVTFLLTHDIACHADCRISHDVTNYAVIFANKLRSPMTHVRGIPK